MSGEPSLEAILCDGFEPESFKGIRNLGGYGRELGTYDGTGYRRMLAQFSQEKRKKNQICPHGSLQ